MYIIVKPFLNKNTVWLCLKVFSLGFSALQLTNLTRRRVPKIANFNDVKRLVIDVRDVQHYLKVSKNLVGLPRLVSPVGIISVVETLLGLRLLSELPSVISSLS